jgi:uncharacterized protein (TIGR03032 family)
MDRPEIRMKTPSMPKLWARHSREWRHSAQIVSQWRDAASTPGFVLRTQATPGWWETLERLGITLFVTREYEHLVIAISVLDGSPYMTFLPLPHPSGLVVDRQRNRVFIASTRNPNQVYTLRPVRPAERRVNSSARGQAQRALCVPVQTAFYPGGLYIHDLAIFGHALHANAVGQNAVIRLDPEGNYKRVWWPKCIETGPAPVFSQNHIQLNSIAGGATARDSYYSASSCCIERRRPGHLNYPVDGRGVVFSGRTREPVCTGLTRPHSARLSGRRIWVANSGYGELGFVSHGKLEVVARLPGWTRGLCIVDDIVFAATSRVIPRFARYAPGLDVDSSRCAVYAICGRTGSVLGRLEWPSGNQVFAIDWIASLASVGLPFAIRPRGSAGPNALFSSFELTGQGE